jgi:hypothetical protein
MDNAFLVGLAVLLGSLSPPVDKPLKNFPECTSLFPAQQSSPLPLYITDSTIIILDDKKVSSMEDIPDVGVELIVIEFHVDEQTKRALATKLSFRSK